ncbi:glucosidase II beta subunit-like protein-domain-containing protein [Coniella lustricola]|uniref:Endoplasmic reticulum lectin n=1 Tax=Coniella lustricola TaxID=2025994 RepID=A0A2T3AIE7_9PEZI|nr:glucosidase II beta subunit-like protein-domain-containing protein [Coniella lustricola]
MRRLQFVLLAGLQLCSAKQPGFSIHDDMLAYPQYEITFTDSFISEIDAQRLVESTKPFQPSASSSSSATHAAGILSQTTDLTSQSRESGTASPVHNGNADDGMPEISEEFEIMHIPPSKYLCSVPVLAPPPAPNKTATELAKAEEARELARANSKGWELMSALDNQCLYYVSGWWSYKFCYGQDIVQFHALPGGMTKGLPVKEPNTAEYVLGRVEQEPAVRKKAKAKQFTKDVDEKVSEDALQNKDLDSAQKPLGGDTESTPTLPPNAELQVKGDQRFLVQRMEGGTLCDLTGRPRMIEVQFHCNPGAANDRIGWIKELTTCSYLMLVHTPRLCEDVAFLPPKETHAHPISCQVIIDSEDDIAAWRLRKSIEAAEQLQVGQGQEEGQAEAKGDKEAGSRGNGNGGSFKGMEIGGVIIGGKQLLRAEDGQPPPKLKPPKGFIPGKAPTTGPLKETLAKGERKSDGGKVEKMSDEELEKLNLDPDAVEQFRQEIEKIAGDKGWTLEVVEIPGEVPEIVGILEDDGEMEYYEDEEIDESADGSQERFFKEEL